MHPRSLRSSFAATLIALAAPLPAFAALDFGARMQAGMANFAYWMGFAKGPNPNQAPSFVRVLGIYINGILTLLGVLFLVFIIWGGIKWMLAAGNEEQVTKAKGVIKNSAIGLSIILLARTITYVFLDIVLPTLG